MNETEQKQRNAVVALAKTWIGTPYRSGAGVRGMRGGVDCAHLPAAVYSEAGLIPKMEIDYYPQDWHLHRSTERYLAEVMRYAKETQNPQPGDLVVWRFGRCFSHGAIITAWPHCVHAFIGVPCSLVDAEREHRLKYVGEAGADHGKPRPRKFFTLWGNG